MTTDLFILALFLTGWCLFMLVGGIAGEAWANRQRIRRRLRVLSARRSASHTRSV